MKQGAMWWVLAWGSIGAAVTGCVAPEVPPATDDPDLGREFRLHHASPGGMWLPHRIGSTAATG